MSRLIDWNGLSRFLYNCKQIFSRKPTTRTGLVYDDGDFFAFKANYGHVYEVIVVPDDGEHGAQIITVSVEGSGDSISYASANNLQFYQTVKYGEWLDGNQGGISGGDYVVAFYDEIGFYNDKGYAFINISVKDLTSGEKVPVAYMEGMVSSGISVSDTENIACLEEDIISILNTL